MKNCLIIGLLLCLGWTSLQAQSYAYGIKGGATIGFQKWDNFSRDPLFKYHGILFIESAPESNEFAVFAQAGFHIKGSAIRNRNAFNPNSGITFRPATREFQFRNFSLTLGGKQKYDLGASSKVYYLIGLRGDYTLNTNLSEYEEFNQAFPAFAIYPYEAFVRKFNYGVTVGGGMEFLISDKISGIVEFTVNPDFSRQYRQPPLPNLRDPITGNNITTDERQITNTTFEISVGLRFLQEVEYID